MGVQIPPPLTQVRKAAPRAYLPRSAQYSVGPWPANRRPAIELRACALGDHWLVTSARNPCVTRWWGAKVQRGVRQLLEAASAAQACPLLTDQGQTAQAWASGADGERRLGTGIDALADSGLLGLHDRRIPGTSANIDHIVFAPGGIFIVDLHRGRQAVQGPGAEERRGPPRPNRRAPLPRPLGLHQARRRHAEQVGPSGGLAAGRWTGSA